MQLYPVVVAGRFVRMIVPAAQVGAVNFPAVAPPTKLDATQDPDVPVGTVPLEIRAPVTVKLPVKFCDISGPTVFPLMRT